MKELPSVYQNFIYKRTYSRYIDEEQRRETFDESVDRYARFFEPRVPEKLKDEFKETIDMVKNLEVMPSMRALWTAGEALDRDNICAYNCAYTSIERPKDFAEILYILMNGTGVGFSVERQFISKLPVVPEELEELEYTIVVEDSKLGWAEAYDELLNELYQGSIPQIDYSLIRPKGARLKTFGGRASGHEPLKQLFEFTIKTFKEARGRKLNSLECYDLATTVASIVIVGGVRRSATISLSNLSDRRMAGAKQGQFWVQHPNRTLSNNSVAYTEKPDMKAFMEEWLQLMKSGSGERGIVNRVALQKSAEKTGRDPKADYGMNPCGEVILKDDEFCNLTEVVIRPEDKHSDLVKKVQGATILGVLQATLDDFHFINDNWKLNVQEERLLGVSLTGMRDHPLIGTVGVGASRELEELKKVVRTTAKKWAKALGINVPKAVTSVKPSGTVSQLVNASSGIHPRYAPYYIRRVRVAKEDPITQFLLDKGVPAHPEVGQTWENYSTVVFEFPLKSPEGSFCKDDEGAIEQLEYWKQVKLYWTEHNPSQTIYVSDDEWMEVGAWVYKNFDLIGGLSFLPRDGGVYELAPYEEINEEQYNELQSVLPDYIDWSELDAYEETDMTQGSREYACVAGACDL